MKRKRHPPEEIIKKLREAATLLAGGQGVEEVCKKLEVSPPTCHRWRQEYGGAKEETVKRLVEAAHGLGVRGVETRRGGQSFHILPITLRAIAMLQRPRAGAGFDHTAVEAQLASFEQPMRVQRRQQHPVDGFELCETQAVANHTERGMIRRGFRERVTQIAADGKAVGAAARNRTLTGQILEKSHRQHLQINHRINARPSTFARVRISRLANRPDLPGEADLLEGGVDSPRKSIWQCGRQLARHHPWLLLLFLRCASCKHTLTLILARRSVLAGFSTGCYAALETRSGEILGKTARRHTSAEFVGFLKDIVASQPAGKMIHVMANNPSAHKTKLVDAFLELHPPRPHALHADLLVLAQPSRELVC